MSVRPAEAPPTNVETLIPGTDPVSAEDQSTSMGTTAAGPVSADRTPVTLPRPVLIQRMRPSQSNVPGTRAQREEILSRIRIYIQAGGLVPPLPQAELREQGVKFCISAGVDERFAHFCSILLNNELWKDTLAAVPYDRRLLLMPKCLRIEAQCPAPFDEIGLLCKKCGLCTIQELQEEAEQLGYAVLVAEGSPLVMALIETGRIEAIVGVSCLNVLERMYPYMEAAAIPGMAVPLLQDDCIDTTVDTEWVWDMIHLTSQDSTYRLDLSALRDEVDSWFHKENLASVLGRPDSRTEEIAHDWLARAGKRWRPFLTVALYHALGSGSDAGSVSDDLKRVALSVECFHKASLIHDDIADDDDLRYGLETLHKTEGVGVALNVGDFLIGEGYRLLSECGVLAEHKSELVLVAARGHRTLSLGQGDELTWGQAPAPLRSRDVLTIFKNKTAPAFEVALRLGAVLAGCHESMGDLIARYSEALGIAYQIHDDLRELAPSPERREADESRDTDESRARETLFFPTIPMAIAHERASGATKVSLARVWCRQEVYRAADWLQTLEDSGALSRCRELEEAYKEEAIRSLREVSDPTVKGLLRRVIGKIFNDLKFEGYCGEFEARNAASGASGPDSAG